MLNQLALAIDVLETNALVINHAIAYAQWLAPGLTAAGAWWAGYQTVCWVRARYAACRTARAEARHIARETALECQAAADLDACELIWDLDAADAELDRRIQRLRDTRKENDQP